MSFEKPIPILKTVQEIQANKYVLPAIQREFVWDTIQIEKLFDSLMKGYPIGSFLFWQVQPERIGDFQFYRFMDRYHERDYNHNEPINLPADREVIAVLDGQQRLTALNIGLHGWYAYKLPRYWWNNDQAFPKRWLYINLLEPKEVPENGYEFKFLRESDFDSPTDTKHWFKVGDVLKFKDIQSTFEYCVENGLTENRQKYPSNTLMGLWRVLVDMPLINYFLEEEQDLDKVLNIFIRVNSGGTPLSYSDMLLSIATAAWKDRDARQEIYELVDHLNHIGDGFNFDKDFVLKAGLVLTDITSFEFRVNNFNRENMLILESNWAAVTAALKGSAYLLYSWGYNWQNLVSTVAVIPLAYYLFHIGSPINFSESLKYKDEREKMRYWLRVALLKRTFSGTPDNVLRPIRKAMQSIKENQRFPLETILDELSTTTRSMRFDQEELEGVLSFHYGQSYTFSVLSFLYPWLKYEQQFHIDHVFPKSMFKKNELKKLAIPEERWSEWMDHVNDMGNLQLLQGAANQSKSDQEFESWLKSEAPSPNDLASYRDLHMIPDVDLAFENFPAFLEKRTKMMREKLAETLSVHLVDDNYDQ